MDTERTKKLESYSSVAIRLRERVPIWLSTDGLEPKRKTEHIRSILTCTDFVCILTAYIVSMTSIRKPGLHSDALSKV